MYGGLYCITKITKKKARAYIESEVEYQVHQKSKSGLWILHRSTIVRAIFVSTCSAFKSAFVLNKTFGALGNTQF